MTLAELYDWAKRHFKIGWSQVLLYMSYAETTDDLSVATDSLPAFARTKGNKRPTSGAVHRDYRADIDAILANVDFSSLKQEALKRAEEDDARRKLALQLIDIGYKALATKLHPEKAASPEAMTRLNQVRDRLKASAWRGLSLYADTRITGGLVRTACEISWASSGAASIPRRS